MLIGIAVIMINSGIKKATKLQVLLCILVFIINGMTSIVSKVHQINIQLDPVNTQSFAFLTCLTKVLLCGLIYLIVPKDRCKQKKHYQFKISGSLNPLIFYSFSLSKRCSYSYISDSLALRTCSLPQSGQRSGSLSD